MCDLYYLHGLGKSLIWSVHKYPTAHNNLEDHLYIGCFKYKHAIVIIPATFPRKRQLFAFKYSDLNVKKPE